LLKINLLNGIIAATIQENEENKIIHQTGCDLLLQILITP